MTIYRYCRRCKSQHAERHCPTCPPKRGRDTAARAAQRDFRNALLAASDGHCAYVGCGEMKGLVAAHLAPYAADGNFTHGAMLCPVHHRLLDHGA